MEDFFRIRTNPTIAKIGMIIQTAQNNVSTTELDSEVISPSLFKSIAVFEFITSLASEIDSEIVPFPG